MSLLNKSTDQISSIDNSSDKLISPSTTSSSGSHSEDRRQHLEVARSLSHSSNDYHSSRRHSNSAKYFSSRSRHNSNERCYRRDPIYRSTESSYRERTNSSIGHADRSDVPKCLFEWALSYDPILDPTHKSKECIFMKKENLPKSYYVLQDPRQYNNYLYLPDAKLFCTTFEIDDNSFQKNLPPDAIFCKGLDKEMTKIQLHSLFEQFQSVRKIEAMINPIKMIFTGKASIKFGTPICPKSFQKLQQTLKKKFPNCCVFYDKNGDLYAESISRMLKRSHKEAKYTNSLLNESNKNDIVKIEKSVNPPAEMTTNSSFSSKASLVALDEGIKTSYCIKMSEHCSSKFSNEEIYQIFRDFSVVNIFGLNQSLYVELDSQSSCNRAIIVLNDTVMMGQKLILSYEPLRRLRTTNQKEYQSSPLFGTILKGKMNEIFKSTEFSTLLQDIKSSPLLSQYEMFEREMIHSANNLHPKYQQEWLVDTIDSLKVDKKISKQSQKFKKKENILIESADQESYYVEPIENSTNCDDQLIYTCVRLQGYPADWQKKKSLKNISQSLKVLNLPTQVDAHFTTLTTRKQRAQQRNLRSMLPEEMKLTNSAFVNRTKQLKLTKSSIHAFGIFSMEDIDQGDFVIEYVGEVIRTKVGDFREKYYYSRSRDASSYLFRVDDEIVIDATVKGNLARFMNHSCEPLCTAKVLNINGQKRICVYAKKQIFKGEEITYDYKFPIEDEKIPCLCGAPTCSGTLN